MAVWRRRCSALNLSSGVRWSHGWKEIKSSLCENPKYISKRKTEQKNSFQWSVKKKQNWKGSHLILQLCNVSFWVIAAAQHAYKISQIIMLSFYTLACLFTITWSDHIAHNVLDLCTFIKMKILMFRPIKISMLWLGFYAIFTFFWLQTDGVFQCISLKTTCV